jgi:membrane-bound inhibitor of C-type lysozyme
MFKQYRVAAAVSMLIALSLAGCASSSHETELKVHIGQPVHYRSQNGDNFVARYGSLSDNSLHFARVQMPGGREYTLPQVVSASGVRYTDERDLVWWTHQGTVSVEVRDAEGNWVTKYSELREVPEEN